MKQFAIVVAILVSVLACSSDRAPVSPSAPDATAMFGASPSRTQSVVVETNEVDAGADGTVDIRTILTTSYDSHGDAVKEVYEEDGSTPQGQASHATTVSEYNPHHATLEYVTERDEDGDGTVDSRTTLQTVATDKRGNPIQQVRIDYDGGVEMNRVEIVNQFDARGRVVAFIDGRVQNACSYDSHDNLVMLTQTVPGSEFQFHREYSAHDALIKHDDVSWLGGVAQRWATTSTVAYDKQDYPLSQVVDNRNRFGHRDLTARVLTYDGHHNLLTRTDDVDYLVDGSVNVRVVTRWEYFMPYSIARH